MTEKKSRSHRIAVLLLLGGCAGPPALHRAIRPADERAYEAAMSRDRDDPRGAYFQWKAEQAGVSIDRIVAADGALSRTVNPFDANRDPADVSRGAVIYKAHCMRCHGQSVDGKGPDVLPAHPCKNFHAFAKRFAVTLHRGAPRNWFRKISDGHGPEVDYPGGASRAMPAFGGALSNEQIWLAITYLQSLDIYASAPESE